MWSWHIYKKLCELIILSIFRDHGSYILPQILCNFYKKWVLFWLLSLFPHPSPPTHCCCSVTQLCPTLCYFMDCNTPGFPVLHSLPEFAQTHVHWVGDAIQSSHPLLLPSAPALNLSQHQGLLQLNQFFSSGGQSVGASASASVLSMNIQDWFPLGWTGWISRQSKGLSRVFSNTTVQKHQSFSAQLSL